MAYVGRLIRQRQAVQAQESRELNALKRDRAMVEVPFEWHNKQTDKAARFPSYGWVPHVALRWRKPSNEVVPWCVGGQPGDVLLMAAEFAARKKP